MATRPSCRATRHRSEEHTSELQSRGQLVCRLLLEKKKALVVRPANAVGRLPIALITHGKNVSASKNQALRADLMRPQARDFAARGWLAVVVIRRGYGQSDGFPGVSRGAVYMTCQNSDLVRGFDTEADDLAGALEALAARQDAFLSRMRPPPQSTLFPYTTLFR